MFPASFAGEKLCALGSNMAAETNLKIVRGDSDFESRFEQMLGSIDARPRIAIDRTRKILWQSENAARLLSSSVPLQISDGTLKADSRTAQSAMNEFIEQIGHNCDTLLVRGQTQRHWAMVIAWSFLDRPDEVCLLLNLSIPHRSVKESGLASALKLTATETRVLDEFARLKTPREIGEQMNISLSTVRSHLKQIHCKADVGSAVQLTQLVRGYCSC